MQTYVQGRHICGACFLFFFRSPKLNLAALAALLSCWKYHLALIWMSGLLEASAAGLLMDQDLSSSMCH